MPVHLGPRHARRNERTPSLRRLSGAAVQGATDHLGPTPLKGQAQGVDELGFLVLGCRQVAGQFDGAPEALQLHRQVCCAAPVVVA